MLQCVVLNDEDNWSALWTLGLICLISEQKSTAFCDLCNHGDMKVAGCCRGWKGSLMINHVNLMYDVLSTRITDVAQ